MMQPSQRKSPTNPRAVVAAAAAVAALALAGWGPAMALPLAATSALPAALPAHGLADDGLADDGLADDALAQWAALQPAGSPAGALAALGASALGSAPALAQPGLRPSEVVEALAPLLDAQTAAGRALAPWHEPDDHVARWTAQAAATLRAAEALPADPAPREALDLAFALRAAPAAAQPLPDVPAFASLPEAVAALFEAHGKEAPPALLEEAAALAPPNGPAVTRILEAYLFAAEATRRAFAADPDAPDLGLLAQMQRTVAGIVLDATATMEPLAAPRPGEERGGAICNSGLLGLELTGDANQWSQHCAVIIDRGGDDVYTNNAGGAQLSGLDTLPVAIVVDLGGNDRYLGQCPVLPGTQGNCGVNGGARQGSGFLLDLGAGDDVYQATVESGAISRGGINGGALTGAGLLFDDGGDDLLDGTVRDGGVNGGALLNGVGLLVSGGGANAFVGHVGSGGVNGGARDGLGALVQAGSGDDLYQGTLDRDGGANGGASGPGAHGLLLDLGGDDAYTGAALQFGTESLAAVNGAGAHLGSGVLLDAAGADVYEGAVATAGAANGGAFRGAGLLLDMAEGADRYTAAVPAGGANGGALVGVAVLVDEAGGSAFAAGPMTEGASHGAAGGASLFPIVPSLPLRLTGGLGLLLTGDGDDAFTSSHVTQGAADIYALGLLLDRGGANTFTAGPGSFAQGAGRSGGLGLLVDRGADSTFVLEDAAAGQGAGRQGVGLLLRPEGAGGSRYLNDAGALALLTSGAGVGMRLDLGTLLAGALDEPRCTGSRELSHTDVSAAAIGPAPATRTSVRVCAPDDSTAECIVDPLTGRPVRVPPVTGEECKVPKPPTPCGPQEVCDAVEELLGPEADDWLAADHLEATTSGGLTTLRAVLPGGERSVSLSRAVVASADHSCRVGCAVLR